MGVPRQAASLAFPQAFSAKWIPVRVKKMREFRNLEHFQAKWIPVRGRKCVNPETWSIAQRLGRADDQAATADAPSTARRGWRECPRRDWRAHPRPSPAWLRDPRPRGRAGPGRVYRYGNEWGLALGLCFGFGWLGFVDADGAGRGQVLRLRETSLRAVSISARSFWISDSSTTPPSASICNR